MRLIDADVMIKNLETMKSQYDAITLDGMIKGLEQQPTAYDVQKVINQLERNYENAEYDELLNSDEREATLCTITRDISIGAGIGRKRGSGKMKHSDEYNELLKRRAEELKQRDEEIKINPLSQYSTGELKAELRRRKRE